VLSPDAAQQTALHRAAHFGSFGAIELCLRFTSLKIHTKDSLGNSPLHAAAANFHVGCLRLMVTHPRFESTSHIYLRTKNKADKSPLILLKDCIEQLAAKKQAGSTVTVSENDLYAYLYQETIPVQLLFLADKARET
jgi:ankyrin repeat protein